MSIGAELVNTYKKIDFVPQENDFLSLVRRAEERGDDVVIGNLELPIHDYKDRIFDALIDNRVLIIGGSTGSGKSTQIPQEALNRGYSSVTEVQVRRIAARELSARIGQELAGSLGSEAVGLAGFHSGEMRSVTEQTQISIMTAGVYLIQKLHELVSDTGDDMKLLIHDEVHLWEQETEVMLAKLGETLSQEPNTKIIIQSATADFSKIAKYISGTHGIEAAVIEIEGRQFPIERIEAKDSTVLKELIKYGQEVKDGILVFLPGEGEIGDLSSELNKKYLKTIFGKAFVLPLYSDLPKREQQAAMFTYDGIKVVLSTNIAQEALTIEGISIVIDCGLERGITIDEEGVSALLLRPTSKASLDQRGGRAGRLGPGIHIVAPLDSDHDFIEYDSRPDFDPPKILSSDLDRMMLRLATNGEDMASYKFMHQPEKLAFGRSKKRLFELGALDEKGLITNIGRRMDVFPVRPSSGRMMVEADRYSPEIRAYMAAIVACIEAGGLSGYDSELIEGWQNLTPDEIKKSDSLSDLASFISHQDIGESCIDKDGFDVKNLPKVRESYTKVVKRSNGSIKKLVEPSVEEIEIIKRCIYAGMANSIYDYAGDGNYVPASSTSAHEWELSNRSVVSTGRRHVDAPSLIVGTPRHVQLHNGEMKHIVERITVVEDPAIFETLAKELCEWVDKKVSWRDGHATTVQELKIGSVALGATREIEAAPSSGLREEIIRRVIDKPGPAQNELRAVKKELEELQKRTKLPVTQLTQEMLKSLVDMATPKDVKDLTHTDNNLRAMIVQGMNLGKFITEEQRQDILRNSPDNIEVGSNGLILKLRYSKGRPEAYGYDVRNVITLGTQPPALADGRIIYFRYSHKVLSLKDLKRAYAFDRSNKQ